MFCKYKYVKVTTPKGRVQYAYQRTILWIHKSYLDLDDIKSRVAWRSRLTDHSNFAKHYLVRPKLQEVKELVQDYFNGSRKVIIEDAETKLEKYLTGGE